MRSSFQDVATALAARYAAGAMTAPTGYTPMRVATADLPGQMTPLPTALVFLDAGEFQRSGNSTRMGSHDWFVRFYYNQAGDLARDQVALRAWAEVLIDQLRDATQLGGLVDLARVDGYTFGILRYADVEYTGIELRVHIVMTEGWAAVA